LASFKMRPCRLIWPAGGAELHSVRFSSSCCSSCLVRASEGATALSKDSRARRREALRCVGLQCCNRYPKSAMPAHCVFNLG